MTMSEARGKLEWGQTSNFMALVANLMRDPNKSGAAKPEDFNPYFAETRKPPVLKAPLTILRDLWCKPKKETK